MEWHITFLFHLLMLYHIVHTVCNSCRDAERLIEASSGTCVSSSGDGSVRLMDIMVTDCPSLPVSVWLFSF